MRKSHSTLKIIIVDQEEAEFFLGVGSFVVVNDEIGWVTDLHDNYALVQTPYDKIPVLYSEMWVPASDFPIIKHAVKDCFINGIELVHCCICGKIHPASQLPLD